MRLLKDKTKELTEEEIKFLRFAAYDTLVQFDENSLPVITDYLEIAKSQHLFILPMQSLAESLGFDVSDYITTPAGNVSKGFVMYSKSTGNYIIAYNENLSREERRWCVSKLIAYIKLGIPDRRPGTYCYVDYDNSSDYADIKSDVFAYSFTCPDIILNECNIKKASDIITYCRIPFLQANRKSKFLSSQNIFNTFSQIEKILKNNFQRFIDYIKDTRK